MANIGTNMQGQVHMWRALVTIELFLFLSLFDDGIQLLTEAKCSEASRNAMFMFREAVSPLNYISSRLQQRKEIKRSLMCLACKCVSPFLRCFHSLFHSSGSPAFLKKVSKILCFK